MKTWTFNETGDNGDKHFTTTRHDDGRLTCNCPGFGQRRTASGMRSCRHTRAVEMEQGPAATSVSQTPGAPVYSAPEEVPFQAAAANQGGLMPQLLQPLMNEELVENYINNNGYVAQEKLDGKRIILDCRNDEVIAYNKLGKVCEIVAEAAKHSLKGCVVDGELIDGVLYIFDVLWSGYDGDMRNSPYQNRYKWLRGLATLPHPGKELETDLLRVCPLAITKAQKQALFARLKAEKREGIVFKRFGAPYRASRNPDQIKFKFVESVSCRVMYHNTAKSSIKIGLKTSPFVPGGPTYTVMGNCTIAQGVELPAVGSIVEIRYLYAFEGGSLFQPVFLGVRDDTEIDSMAQLKYKRVFTGTAPVEGDVEVPKTIQPIVPTIRRKIQWR